MGEATRTPGTGFRRKLAVEINWWVREGLIPPDSSERLSAHYRLADLDAEGCSRLVTAIVIIGCSLVGAGVVTFVAAHWEAIPKTVKVAMLLIAMLGSHAAGFYLWKVRASRPIIGHALVLLGTLIMGANIGLFAQIFHVHRSYHNGLAAWAAGALAMALAVRSVPHSALGIGLLTCWFFARATDLESPNYLFPVLVAAAGGFLAWQQRSGFVAFLTMAALACGILTNPLVGHGYDHQGMTFVLLGLALTVLFWCLSCCAARDSRPDFLTAPARLATRMLFAGFGFTLAFREPTEDLLEKGLRLSSASGVTLGLLVAATAVAAALAAGHAASRRRLLSPASAVYAGLPVLGLALVGLSSMTDGRELPALALVAALVLVNALLLAGGAVLAWRGAVQGKRAAFWCGTLLVVATMSARFLEHTEGLLVKSVVLLAVGAAMIYAGVKFETALRRRRSAEVPDAR